MPALNSHLFPRAARLLLVLLLLALCALQLAPLSYNTGAPSPATSGELPAMQVISDGSPEASKDERPAIEGWVTDKSSGQALQGAIVTLSGVAETTSDESGYFSFSLAQLPAGSLSASDSGQPVTLSVREGSHAPWTIREATFYPGDTLRI
ncbi:MAG TPA: carboxypeptidase-like regulatory domain-containing protein, partial [Chloroflexia bacterium]|nr:carboxypeptidase-like regulatory domain-containing protein [Chloroflexia bacterium]